MPTRPESHKTHDPQAYDFARREDHRFYTTKWWKETRKFVIARDGGICRKCNEAPGIVCDHIEPRWKRPDLAYDVNNLWLLCRECDNRKRTQERL